jgi:hypothetical protein
VVDIDHWEVDGEFQVREAEDRFWVDSAVVGGGGTVPQFRGGACGCREDTVGHLQVVPAGDGGVVQESEGTEAEHRCGVVGEAADKVRLL